MARRQAWAWLLSLSLLGGLMGGCTQVGCGHGFFWFADLPESLTEDEVRALSVIACRNDVCVEGSFDAIVESGHGFLVDPDRPEVETRASLWLHRQARSFRVRLQWLVADPMNGDRYGVWVTDPSGEALIGVDERAFEYSDFAPNGYVAGPVCRQILAEGSTLGAP